MPFAHFVGVVGNGGGDGLRLTYGLASVHYFCKPIAQTLHSRGQLSKGINKPVGGL
jgi:hypothetical protein